MSTFPISPVNGEIVTVANVTYRYSSANNSWTRQLGLPGNLNVGNIISTGFISASGNITGNYIIGNGSQLTGLPAGYANSDVANFLAAFGSNSISTTGNITGGNILTAGLISVTGNITANYFIGNGSQLSNVNAFNRVSVSGQSNVLANTTPGLTFVAGSNISISTDAANGTITFNQSSTTSIFATGGDMGLVTQAVTSSEDLGLVTEAVTEFYDLGSVVTTGSFDTLSVTGNTTTGNLLTGGIVSATGNITGNYFLGNGSQLTGISSGNSSITITETTISANYTIATGQNGLSVGPMTTANGVQVSVASGQRWIIL